MLARRAWQPWRQSLTLQAARDVYLASRQPAPGYSLTTACSSAAAPWRTSSNPACLSHSGRPLSTSTVSLQTSSKESDERLKELTSSSLELYPRHTSRRKAGTGDFWWATDKEDANKKIAERVSKTDKPLPVTVGARIVSIRKSSRKLLFLDLASGVQKLQVMLSYSAIAITTDGKVSQEEFEERCRIMRRGDHVVVDGVPHKTDAGGHCLKALALPTLTSPCLHRFPVVQDHDTSPPEDSGLDRHADMLTFPNLVDTLKLRFSLIQSLRDSLIGLDFTEVQTPILAGLAGGAAARPFETNATEFSDRKISLRIAPELWLKRLMVGGMTAIFEIGPSFRNEGLDKTHNPEFTTCEFYQAHCDLDTLMSRTKSLLGQIRTDLQRFGMGSKIAEIPLLDRNEKFEKIDFIPAINRHLGMDLPTLELSNQDAVLDILKSRNILIPSSPTLPNLLDKLASHYLEPQCVAPTWIMNLPECMSPLSKSFEHPSAPNNQRVAARAELFIKGKEIVNCYEEENSPFAQRQKFIEQHIYASNPAGQALDIEKITNVDGMEIDEDYLRALEWGLPPTGGWGCGIDRLVMLFAGKERISDVLSFGNLRAVTRNAVKMSRTGKRGGN